jgi:acyl dehydratase
MSNPTWPLDPRTAAVGDRLPTLVRTPDRLTMLLFCMSYWAPHRIHTDPEWARSEDYRDTVVNGPLINEFVVSVLSDWSGDPTHLRRFRVRNHAVAFAGDTLTVTASVTAVGPGDREGDGDDMRSIECGFEVTRQDGTLMASGQATLAVPIPVDAPQG